MVSNEELDEIMKRWSNTTGDEWQPSIEGRDHTSGSDFIRVINDGIHQSDLEVLGGSVEDLEFIANCKQDIQTLVQEVKNLRKMTDRPQSIDKDKQLAIIGWMECIDLPTLSMFGVISKIDTGARTSALHADKIEIFEREEKDWVRFVSNADDMVSHSTVIEAPIHDRRLIKNTSGKAEERIIIQSKARFGKRSWTIDISLTSRTNMNAPMIIGRKALKGHSIAVDPKRKYLISQNPKLQQQEEKI